MTQKEFAKFRIDYIKFSREHVADCVTYSTHKSYGYKMGLIKSKNGNLKPCIIKLEIPKDALRTEYMDNTRDKFGKHRCSEARVLGFYSYYTGKKIKINEAYSSRNIDDVCSSWNTGFIYKLGETVYPDSFERARFVCSNGIHYFTNMECARCYADFWLAHIMEFRKLRKDILRLLGMA